MMYRIQGADLREYGPISAEQVRAWVGENRLNRFSLCAGEDGIWKPLGQFPEFAEVLTAAAGILPSAGAVVVPGGAGGAGGAGGPVRVSLGDAGGRERALQLVKTPALFLTILAVLSGLLAVIAPFTRNAQVQSLQQIWPQAPAEVKRSLATQAAASLGAGDFAQTLLVVVCCGVVVYGAGQMRRLDSFAWSAVGAVFSMLWCTGCCCGLGLVAGVWALSVINGRDVRGYFRR